MRHDGICVRVRLTPNAQKDHVVGIVADAQGNGILRVAVNARAEHGRANLALLSYLARQWRLPKSHLILRSGSKNRNKTLLIEGGDEDVLKDFVVWADRLDPLLAKQ